MLPDSFTLYADMIAQQDFLCHTSDMKHSAQLLLLFTWLIFDHILVSVLHRKGKNQRIGFLKHRKGKNQRIGGKNQRIGGKNQRIGFLKIKQ